MNSKTENSSGMDLKPAPKCIGIIMDGNRRFARERGIPLMEGHRLGYQKTKEVMRWAKEVGVEYVIFYAFSTENWNRVPEEVSYLMNLFRVALSSEVDSMAKEGIRLKCIGNLERLPKDIQDLIKKKESETDKLPGPTAVLAISYGGRDEIIRAIKRLTVEKKLEEIERLSEKDFSEFLDTKGIPDPDLIVRTSGEQRLSGFLTWQGVYSELFFSKTYWPAFSKAEFVSILEEFGNRERRHGK